jgi:hypothetical protein
MTEEATNPLNEAIEKLKNAFEIWVSRHHEPQLPNTSPHRMNGGGSVRDPVRVRDITAGPGENVNYEPTIHSSPNEPNINSATVQSGIDSVPVFVLTIGVGEIRSGLHGNNPVNIESTNYDALNNGLKYLCVKHDGFTHSQAVHRRSVYEMGGYKSLSEMKNLFMLSIDQVSKPDLMKVKSSSLVSLPSPLFTEETADGTYINDDATTGTYKIGVSVEYSLPISNKMDSIWKSVRKTGQFTEMSICEDIDNPLIGILPLIENVKRRNGVILVHNDAWSESNPHPAQFGENLYFYYKTPFYKNMFAEGLCWFMKHLVAYHNPNIWLLSRISKQRRSGLMRLIDGFDSVFELPYLGSPGPQQTSIRHGFRPATTHQGYLLSPFNEAVHEVPQPWPPRRGGGTRRRRRHNRKRSLRKTIYTNRSIRPK